MDGTVPNLTKGVLIVNVITCAKVLGDQFKDVDFAWVQIAISY